MSGRQMWEYYRPATQAVEGFQWTGTHERWRQIKGWAVPIKSTNEHIGRRELQVWDRKANAWTIAKVGDYVLHSIPPEEKGWWYRVIPQAEFEATYVVAERPVYLPPGVYT